MTTLSDNDWLAKLIDSAKWLFNVDTKKLEKLEEIHWKDRKWINFATHSLDADKVKYCSVKAPVDALKAATVDDEDIKNLDFNDIQSKMYLLKGLFSEVASDQSGEKRLTFSLNLKTGRLNDALALLLIAFIQFEHGKQKDEDFAKSFIDLLLPLREATNQSTQPQTDKRTGTPAAVTSAQQLNMTLILFFGQSHKATVNEINDKKQLNGSDYDLLENKCEWFWWGLSEEKPAETDSDVQDNMCWLQLNMELNNPPKVINLLHIKDLIKKIKKQPEIITLIKSNGSTTFNLDNKNFIKA